MAPRVEVGKPGTNFLQVTPEHRKKINSIVKYYRKKPHPFRACLTADTPVDVPRDLDLHPDGVAISELRTGDLAWSFNEVERRFELKRVLWAEPTRRNAELMEVTLDTGKTIRATPDHPFLLRDGRWAAAATLRAGDSLMPLYRDFEPRIRLTPDSLAFTPEHDVVAEATHGPLDGRHVHHADQRRANVDPENLHALTGSEHIEAHHREFSEAIALREERWLCPDCEELYTPARRNQRRCDPCHILRGYQKQIVGKRAACAVCETEFVLRAPNQRYCSKLCRHRAKKRGISRPGKVGGVPNAHAWNHRVLAVRPLTEREDVWDIEVEDNHTFVVHGVVVHNCVRDNRRRFGPRTEQVCAVVKDMALGTTKWRKGGKKHLSAQGIPTTIDLSASTIARDLVGLYDELAAKKSATVIDLAEWDGS